MSIEAPKYVVPSSSSYHKSLRLRWPWNRTDEESIADRQHQSSAAVRMPPDDISSRAVFPAGGFPAGSRPHRTTFFGSRKTRPKEGSVHCPPSRTGVVVGFVEAHRCPCTPLSLAADLLPASASKDSRRSFAGRGWRRRSGAWKEGGSMFWVENGSG